MDRAEPRQPQEGGSPAPGERAADTGDPILAVPRALPAPEDPDRPRGRHEAQRRSVGGPAGAAIAVVVVAVVAAGVLATWLIGSAEEAPAPPASVPAAGSVASTPAGQTSRPPGAGVFGNLVTNWSFEQDLNGWSVLGEADPGREPQGRTSGSCASVRARGPEPGTVGLALPSVVPSAAKGARYVASAWVRSTAPGQRVTIRLVGAGADPESSQTTTTTLPGLAWRRVIVDHTVTTKTDLGLEITADGVPAGDALLLDEVVVRRG